MVGFKCHPLTQPASSYLLWLWVTVNFTTKSGPPEMWGILLTVWAGVSLLVDLHQGGRWVSSDLHGHCSKRYCVQHSRNVLERTQTVTKNNTMLWQKKKSPSDAQMLSTAVYSKHKAQKRQTKWKVIRIQTYSPQRSKLFATPKQIKLALVKVSHSLKTLPGFGCLREELITGVWKAGALWDWLPTCTAFPISQIFFHSLSRTALHNHKPFCVHH